jgi:two-component system chemotaxis response regulator CheB/chemosensory pili system protein ChpB (putative protein-glutamate methylesterase)
VPDHLIPRLPRIALVFGDEAAAAHLREALQAHVEIAYASDAGSFDAARMAAANVDAALVNLDDGGCLDTLEAVLDAADVPVVYNDPEISRGLEGWARARWLRHLLAKLRGSSDVDPPRPGQPSAGFGVPSAAAPRDPQGPHHAGVYERPLSPQEIETMTADFVQESAGVAAGDAARSAVADAPAQTAAPGASPDALEPVQAPAVDDLEVDTETLSAMIDARLADANSRLPPDSPEVWRVVEGGPVTAAAPVAGAESTSRAAPAEAAGDSDEPSLSLPSLDDWQLVDTDAAPAPAPRREQPKNPELALAESLAGLSLELEPMETVTQIAHAEPIERWLHESEPRKAAANPRSDAEAESVGGKA